MIEVETATALTLYLALFLGICFLAWFVTQLKQRKQSAFKKLEALITCEYCHHVYLAPPGKPVSKCPECDCLNQD